MKRLAIILLSFCLHGVASAAPYSAESIYVIDARSGPAIHETGETGLTVYLPLSEQSDYHNGLAPKQGEGLGFGSFTRTTTGYCTRPDGILYNTPVNTPRIAVFNGKTGLLLESGATNNAKRSEEFDQWGAFNGGATPDQIAAPNGHATADLIYENTANDQHHVSMSIDGYFPKNQVITYSVYAKANTRSWLRLLAKTYETTYPAGFFNLATGAVGTNSGASDIGIDAIGNGWYRCWMSFATSSGAGALTAYCGLASADNTGTYVGENKSLYAWGYQAELTAYPTSYVATSATTGYRNEEVAKPQWTLPNGVFDGTSAVGTLVLSWCPLFDYTDIVPDYFGFGVLSARTGNASSLLRMHYNDAANDGRLATVDNAGTAPYVNADWSRGTWHKVAIKWGYLVSGQSKFNIGYDTGAGLTWATPLNFTKYNTTGTKLETASGVSVPPFMIRAVRVFDRVLTDAEIQQLNW